MIQFEIQMIWNDCIHMCMKTIHHCSFDIYILTVFLSESGLVYGRLSGITKHTLRTDILNLLEGCNLTLQDVKVDYNRSYFPVGM